MALQDLLDLSQSKRKIGLSEERVRAIIPIARKYIAFWREYPDLFVDFLVVAITFFLHSGHSRIKKIDMSADISIII